MPIRLHIEAESVAEFDELLARFSHGVAPARPAPAPNPTPSGHPIDNMTVAEIKEIAGKAGPGELRGLLTAEKAGKSRATAVAALEAAIEAGNAPAGSAPAATSEQASSTEDNAAESAPTPSTQQEQVASGSDAPEITEQDLKDALSALLKAKSATQAMKVLEEASGGCKSLTSGSPNVLEKAKDDPAIMGRVHAALLAAAQA